MYFWGMETGKLYIPNLNPIPLYAREQLNNCNEPYAIKYEQSDKTFLQFFSIDAAFSLNIRLCTNLDKIVKNNFTVQTEKKEIDSYTITFYSVLINFSGLTGNHYIELEIINNIGEKCLYHSPCISIKEKHENTSHLLYYNSVNANNVLFNNNLFFALRTEGGYLPKAYSPKVQENIYQNQEITFQLLESTPYNSYFFTAGGERGIPDWFFDKIHRAFSCDTLFINNTAMVKMPEATWSPAEEDGYPFRTWKIEMMQNNDNLSLQAECIEDAKYHCTFEWLDDAAICQLEGKIGNFPSINILPNGFNPSTAFINVNISFLKPVASNLQINFSCQINVIRMGGPSQSVPYSSTMFIPKGSLHAARVDNVMLPTGTGTIQTIGVGIGYIQNINPREDDKYIYQGAVPEPVKTGNSLRIKGIYKLYRNDVLQSQANYNILDAFTSGNITYPAITPLEWSRYTNDEAEEREAAKIDSINKCSNFEKNEIIGYRNCVDIYMDVLGGGDTNNNKYILNFGNDTAIFIKITK